MASDFNFRICFSPCPSFLHVQTFLLPQICLCPPSSSSSVPRFLFRPLDCNSTPYLWAPPSASPSAVALPYISTRNSTRRLSCPRGFRIVPTPVLSPLCPPPLSLPSPLALSLSVYPAASLSCCSVLIRWPGDGDGTGDPPCLRGMLPERGMPIRDASYRGTIFFRGSA